MFLEHFRRRKDTYWEEGASIVVPVEAGIQNFAVLLFVPWSPAFAGMRGVETSIRLKYSIFLIFWVDF